MTPPSCPRPVVVTGLGLCCALGSRPLAVARAIEAGECGLAPDPDLSLLPAHNLTGQVSGPNLRPWLKRRKDRKLLARPAQLALASAGDALGDWNGDRQELGIFLGVGREPPDRGESEAAFVASARDGRLDEALLATDGRDLYPPLLPLQTLPNMALAHISINLGLRGENGAWAGEAATGLRAVCEAVWAVSEGRCSAALAGAADCQLNPTIARDRLRRGKVTPPGEASAMLLIEPLDRAWERGAKIHAQLRVVDPVLPGAQAGADPSRPQPDPTRLRQALGDCGSADGVLALLLAILRARHRGLGSLVSRKEIGQSPVGLRVRPPGPC